MVHSDLHDVGTAHVDSKFVVRRRSRRRWRLSLRWRRPGAKSSHVRPLRSFSSKWLLVLSRRTASPRSPRHVLDRSPRLDTPQYSVQYSILNRSGNRKIFSSPATDHLHATAYVVTHTKQHWEIFWTSAYFYALSSSFTFI